MSQTIAVLGGTGNLGYALARRWALAGRSVVIGSREAGKAVDAAKEIAAEGAKDVRGDENLAAAAAADIVVLTVPFANQSAVLEHVKSALKGKVLIDTTVPLVPPRVARVQLPPEGSAALKSAGIVGEEVRVVSAFHNVPADGLRQDGPLECDVLVFGDDKAAREDCVALAELGGMKAYHAGSLANSVAAEALTSVLIFLNKNYGGHAGIQLTGLGH